MHSEIRTAQEILPAILLDNDCDKQVVEDVDEQKRGYLLSKRRTLFIMGDVLPVNSVEIQ